MKPKILFWDIETTPILAHTWTKYPQNGVIAIERDWQLLSFAYKYSGKKRVHVESRKRWDEKTLVKILHTILADADILVAHNGDAFDFKKANAKFIQFGLSPIAPPSTVDTRKVAKKYFNFSGNSLNDLCKLFNIGKKENTGGFDLWQDCMSGKKSAFHKMEKYNKQDVVLLEKVYTRLLPWMNNHPSIPLIQGKEDGCPKCGGDVKSYGLRHNGTYSYRRYQCMDCGGWCRSRRSESLKVNVK